MSKTIKTVKPNVRPWQSSYGPMESVDGYFDDGDEWTINCKQGNGDKTKAEMTALAGKPLDGFTVEANIDKNTGQQREYQGHKKWNLKKQQAQGGGGFGPKRDYVPAYNQTKEGFDIQQLGIIASVALDKANAYAGTRKELTPIPDTLAIADRYFDWLLSKIKGVAAPVVPDTAKQEALKDFGAAVDAAKDHRKQNGKSVIDLTTLAEALATRGWDNTGFKTRIELQTMLGPERFKQLTKAIDVNPLTFEKVTHLTEEAA